MHDIQSPRRRRNQPEIDSLVREFRGSGLNQRKRHPEHPAVVVLRVTLTPDLLGTTLKGSVLDVDRYIGQSHSPDMACKLRVEFAGAHHELW